MLSRVEKPARYAGGEYNSVFKQDADLNFALCFADIYEIGMSHLGMQILYEVLNGIPYVYAERAFCPWMDAVKIMSEDNIALKSLETGRVLNEFDIIGINLSYEMSYTNVPLMLKLGGVPLTASQRAEKDPIVIAGGACTVNPEPMAEFFDAMVIGEGEEVVLEICALLRSLKNSGAPRGEILKALAHIPGVYVPSLYEPMYDVSGSYIGVKALCGAPDTVHKRIVENFSDAPTVKRPVVPYLSVVHDRCTLEIMRGCPNGCRFCQAGFVTRPVRERSVENLVSAAENILNATGYDEISLCSLSSGDYSKIEELARLLSNKFADNRVSLSLPSMRVDKFNIASEIQRVRVSGVTFAPEAGTQRLRDVINKNITEDEILNAVQKAFRSGAHTVKLYFMVGLPTERQEDLDGIADLVKKIRQQYFEIPKEERSGRLSINVSASNFVPKPGTPFQWEAMNSIERLREKQLYLKDLLKIKFVKFNYHDPETSFMEAAFARGDRRFSKLIIKAHELGSMFDAWAEGFSFSRFIEAAESLGINLKTYVEEPINFSTALPYDHISTNLKKEYLLKERMRAYAEKNTPPCNKACSGCGVAESCGFWGFGT